MPESNFSGLLHTLDRSEISRISTILGASEPRVSRGMESAVAAVLAALARQVDHFGTLQNMLDLVPTDLEQVSWSKLASGMTNSACPWMEQGKNITSALFGPNSDAISTLIGRENSVGPDTAATMLATAAPMTLSFLKRRVRDDALSMHGLSALLRQESGTVRSALSADLNHLLSGRPTAVPAATAPNRPIRPAPRSSAWVGTLGLALVMLGGLWIWSHVHRIGSETGVGAIGSASRIAGEAGRLGETGTTPQTGGREQPASEVETRLLGTLGASDASGHPAWVTFNRLRFAPGSTRLSADSSDDLNQIATLLNTHPKLRLVVAGFADRTGHGAESLRDSRLRAGAVKAALVARAVSQDRITTQGLEEVGLSADTSTPQGLATNRAICMRVSQP